MVFKPALRLAVASPMRAFLADWQVGMGLDETSALVDLQERDVCCLSAMIVVEQIVSLHERVLVQVRRHI